LKKAKENPIDNYRHAAAIIKGGKLLSTGINTNKKGVLVNSLYGEKGCHAELMALCKLPEDKIKGSVLYVAGWSKGNNIVKSKPCSICQKYIAKFDLKAVYYSVPSGEYEKMRIEG
jgi:Deoxycytidylate deaminase